MAEVQRRHPLLSARIIRTGDQLIFAATSDPAPPIGLRLASGDSSTWMEQMQLEATLPFDLSGHLPLVRAVLLRDADSMAASAARATILVTLYHAVGDGMALLNIIRDLLQALERKKLAGLALAPSLEATRALAAAASLPAAAGADEVVKAEPVASPPQRAPATLLDDRSPRPSVSSLRLTAAQTSQLLAAARRRGVTLHALLTAALVTAGQRTSMEWRELPVRVFSPINLRPWLGGDVALLEGVVVALGAGAVEVNSQAAVQSASPLCDGIWLAAQKAYNDLLFFRSSQGRFVLAEALGSLAQHTDSTAIATGQATGFELIVTNPGLVELSAGESVSGLCGPSVLFGWKGEQSVSALTVHGQLSLTYSSCSPIDSLLTDATRLMLQAANAE